jgi:hypothetical protein
MDTLANRNNNPGNLRFVGQQGASQGEGGFARFNSPQEGYAALLNDVQGKLTGKTRTGLTPDHNLVDFIKVYAPAADKNSPGDYAAALANKLGVRPDVSLRELQPKLGQLTEALAEHEGYKGNKSHSQNTFNPAPFSKPEAGQEYNFVGTPLEKDKPKDGILKTLAKGALKPFGEIGVGLYNAASTASSILTGNPEDSLSKSRNLPFLGETKPFMTGQESLPQTAGIMAKYGGEIAPWFMGEIGRAHV